MRSKIPAVVFSLAISALMVLVVDPISAQQSSIHHERQWIRQVRAFNVDGRPVIASAWGLALDSHGRPTISGPTYGAVAGLKHWGGTDIFVRHFTANGDVRLTLQRGTPTNDYAYVAFDPWDNMILVGGSGQSASVPLNREQLTGNASWFGTVIKYHRCGYFLWSREFGKEAVGCTPIDVSTDRHGNVFAVGGVVGSMEGQSPIGQVDAFVVSYDYRGSSRLALQYGTNRDDQARGVITDSSWRILVAGTTWASLDGQQHHNLRDAYVRSHDSVGNRIDTWQFGTAAHDYGSDLVMDDAGNIYVAGQTEGDLFGHSNQGGVDVFLAKFAASGKRLWVSFVASNEDDFVSDVAIGSNGGVFVVGSTRGDLFDRNQGESDAFIARCDTETGKLEWTDQLGTRGRDAAFRVSADSYGGIYVCGEAQGDLSVADSPKAVAQAFLMKYK